MAIIVCRVAWMPCYRSTDEPATGGGSHVDKGGEPLEALNFLPVDDVYYGFVENKNRQLVLEKLGGRREDETLNGVSVVFCAPDPDTKDLLVTGWYVDATVHRQAIERPNDDPGRRVHFTATNATLIGESERCFPIPRAQDTWSSCRGIGQAQFWYGLNEERATEFRQFLKEYMAKGYRETAYQAISTSTRTSEKSIIESRGRRISERLERFGTCRQFIEIKGYRCEACGWSIEKDERRIWGSSFELHHLVPFVDLDDDASRVVCPKDFAVLCASCHRAIHRTEFVSDVERFAKVAGLPR